MLSTVDLRIICSKTGLSRIYVVAICCAALECIYNLQFMSVGGQHFCAVVYLMNKDEYKQKIFSRVSPTSRCCPGNVSRRSRGLGGTIAPNYVKNGVGL